MRQRPRARWLAGRWRLDAHRESWAGVDDDAGWTLYLDRYADLVTKTS